MALTPDEVDQNAVRLGQQRIQRPMTASDPAMPDPDRPAQPVRLPQLG